MQNRLDYLSKFNKYNFRPQINIEQEIFVISIQDRLKMPNFEFSKAHIINFYAIILVTEGNYQHFLEFETYDLQVGDLIVICPNQIHNFIQKDNFDGMIIAFTEEFLNNYLLNSNSLIRINIINKFYELGKVTLSKDTFEQVQQIVLLMQNELLIKKDNNQTAIVQHLLSSFILKVDREISISDETIKIDQYTINVMNFKSLLSKGVDKSKDIQFYADLLNISVRTLQLSTKKVLNCSPIEVINNYIILESKKQLLNSELQIQNIAYNLGFADAAVFSKFFKKHNNISPIDFRKSFKL